MTPHRCRLLVILACAAAGTFLGCAWWHFDRAHWLTAAALTAYAMLCLWTARIFLEAAYAIERGDG